MPTIITMTQTAPTGRLAEVEAAIRDYHKSLDQREQGGVACHKAIERIEGILGLQWRAP